MRKKRGLTFDFSSLDFSMPVFSPDEEARPINRLSPVPVSDENAEALARHIDWQRDYIALVSGAFVFGDFLELLIYVHDLRPTAVYRRFMNTGADVTFRRTGANRYRVEYSLPF